MSPLVTSDGYNYQEVDYEPEEPNPEEAEVLRMKQLLEDLALFPVEMEMDFYRACVKFINGEEAYLPQVNDYEEVT